MHDIIIIGAGPAGLMAARTLKAQGVDSFLVIDSKREIGYPLRCGEGIGVHEFHEFFDKAEYGFIRNTGYEHEVVYEDLKRNFSCPFYQLDRPEFERWMSEDIKDHIKLDSKCIDVEFFGDRVEVVTAKERLAARMIIVSYGCNFFIQKKLNIKKIPDIVIAGYGGIYKTKNIDKRKFYYYFDKDYAGYLWVFPKGDDVANIGFGAFELRDNVKEVLERLLKKYNIEAEKVSGYSGVVPCSGPLQRTYSDKVLFCGNAAGQVYAGTGEGIYFALKSGRLAAMTAVDGIKKNDYSKKILKRYEKNWKKEFGLQMRSGIVFAELLGMAHKFKMVKKAFSSPSETELKGMIIKGALPYRAKLMWRLS
ncbi:NAD(P)/FAD-dependent oxidoreductase, partial [Candidatus Woesearchaeota archaeon]|nr:NAD(P)/FAD-dependent oxidoreductase [Candidatus Woesearchaeota archaeon]